MWPYSNGTFHWESISKKELLRPYLSRERNFGKFMFNWWTCNSILNFIYLLPYLPDHWFSCTTIKINIMLPYSNGNFHWKSISKKELLRPYLSREWNFLNLYSTGRFPISSSILFHCCHICLITDFLVPL